MSDDRLTMERLAASKRRGRRVLVGILIVAVVVLVAPPIIEWWVERDACPTVVLQHGFVEKARWEISRSDCGGGRIVHQLRVIPPKGYSVLAYESEGGPLPVGWHQSGFVGTLTLDRPIDGETATVLEMPLDRKGRPAPPIVVHGGRRVAVP